jgi:RNA-directed DNA polymerase
MPKKIKGVFDDIFSIRNLYEAYLDAARGRRYEREVLRFSEDLWANLRALRDEILSGTYEVKQYYKFYVYEPKKRMVMSIPFRDRVVQWAIYRKINPILAKRYITDSYGCVEGRGQLKAGLRVKGWLEYVSRKPGRWYYLKLDISKYFYRVPHDRLKAVLRKHIADERLLNVLDGIIDCKHTAFGLPDGAAPDDGVEMVYDVGMPIGNLLSQIFANVYLNELDQYCKRVLRCRYYVRYIDDMVILSGSKEQLKAWKMAIEMFVQQELGLKLNRKTCIRPINQGIEFVGYRIWHNRMVLRKSTTLRMKRGLKHMMEAYRRYEITAERARATFNSYTGMLKHTDSKVLTRSLYDGFVLTHAGKEECNQWTQQRSSSQS